MPKTDTIEKPSKLNPASVGSIPTAEVSGGQESPSTANSNVLEFTPASSLQKSREDKSRPSSTNNSLVFSWARFNVIAHELPPLFLEHWKELALNKDVVPLDPDFDKFYALDVQNILRVLTVRDGERLAGYAFLLLGPHLHYKSTIWGHVDMYWLDPALRCGWTGVKLMQTLIRDAKTMGAVNLTLATKTHFMDNRVTKLLQRLGFKPIETIHAMRL